MSKRAFWVLLASCAVVLLGCGGPPPLPPPPPAPPPVPYPPPVAAPEPVRVTPDAPFRERIPDPGPVVTFTPPKIETFTLKNGIRVLFVQRHELPLVSVRVALKVGAGDLPVKPGVLSFVGSMLEQGTQKRSALQISDEYEALGAQHGAWVDWDSGGASVKVTSEHLDAALDLLADVLTHPSFPQAEFDRLKARRLASIQQEKNEPGSMWSNAAAATLFGRAHPYGHSLVGEEADVARMTQADLVHAYQGLVWPKRVSIAVAGDVTKEALESKLGAALGGWKGQGREDTAQAPVPPRPAPKDAPRVILVDRPHAPQSVVRLAEVGVPRSAPDHDAVVLMNTILGGMFSSRINLNLREAHAYTYGAHSGFAMRHGAGSFSAGGSMVSDKTAAAIHELFVEIEAIRDRPVSDEELSDAKESIKLGLPADFETVNAMTGALSDLFVHALPLDEYATLPARVDRLTAEDVQKAAKAHLHPASLRVIVVGDKATLGPQLEQLHLGPIEERDAYGELIK
jgi:zinc protease